MNSPPIDIPLNELVEVNPRDFPVGNSVPYVGMEDVSEDGRLLRIGSRARDAISPGQPAFCDGDVLFAKITPCMENGKGALVSGLGGRVAQGSTEFHVLRARQAVDPRFIYQWTRTPALRRAAAAMMTGSAGQRRVPPAFFAKFKVPSFEFEEQRRIAEILDALDARIEGTKRVIDKHRSVLSGLAQEAVRGNMFDAPVGGWSLATVNELLDRDSESLVQTGPFGSQLHAHEYVNEGIPVVMPQDIVGHTVSTKNIARISEHKARELARHKVRAGDILFSRRGDLSRCACITADQTGWLCGTGCLLLRVSGKVIMPEWLTMAYRDDVCQRQVRAVAVGTTMVNLNTGILQALRVPVPPIEVQQQVMRTLGEQQAVIDWNAAELKSLEVLKQGLAEDLLTGRVRVPEAEAVVESL